MFRRMRCCIAWPVAHKSENDRLLSAASAQKLSAVAQDLDSESRPFAVVPGTLASAANVGRPTRTARVLPEPKRMAGLRIEILRNADNFCALAALSRPVISDFVSDWPGDANSATAEPFRALDRKIFVQLQRVASIALSKRPRALLAFREFWLPRECD